MSGSVRVLILVSFYHNSGWALRHLVDSVSAWYTFRIDIILSPSMCLVPSISHSCVDLNQFSLFLVFLRLCSDMFFLVKLVRQFMLCFSLSHFYSMCPVSIKIPKLSFRIMKPRIFNCLSDVIYEFLFLFLFALRHPRYTYCWSK